jgi:two-component system cell cycle response regulator
VVYLLEAFGHEVKQAREGAEGIEMARRENPDIILLDIHMPKMDGYEVARRLHADAELRKIPVIAVTALAMVGDREKLLDSGFNGYISKPIDPQTFTTKVQTFLTVPALGDPAPELPVKPDSAVGPGVRSCAKRALLLFVDNTPANIHLARSLLEPQGYELLTAGSALEGLDLAQKYRPDLIVSDVHMPHHDGYDFHEMVQADPDLSRIPFVFLSASVWSTREKEKALSRGAAKFLSRPIDGEALISELEALLPPEKIAKAQSNSG